MQTELGIIGTVRNGGHSLSETLVMIDKLRTRICYSRCVIATNDNNDSTDTALASLGKGYEIIRMDGLAMAIPQRVERICNARNVAIYKLRSEPKTPRYTLVIDLDGPNAELNIESILHLITAENQSWEGLFANQKNAYYDLYALRHPNWCPSDCWAEYKKDQKKYNIWHKIRGISSERFKEQLKNKYIYQRQYRIPIDHPWIPVQSAFGGLGLYRSSALNSHWYDTGNRNEQPTCEHVGLHRRMALDGSRFYIVPNLINLAPAESLGPSSGIALPQNLNLMY
jgi:hypothetical protein